MKPATDKRRDASLKKKKRDKFLLDHSRINDVSDVLFDNAMLTVAHSFKAAASFRATEFKELGNEIGEELLDVGNELKVSTKSFIDELTIGTDHKALTAIVKDDVPDAREDDMTSFEDEESRMPASEGIEDSTAAGETAATGDDTTKICRSDYIGDEKNESFGVFTLFSFCAALNCADMETFGGDFLNDKNDKKVVEKDDVDSDLVEKKEKVDWRKNLEGIDWKQIASEAETEAFGALNTSSDKKEKKWKLFKRRGSIKK